MLLFPDFAIFAAKMQALCIAVGIAAGMQPILGYNYGSGQFKRVRKAFNRPVFYGTAFMLAGFVVFRAFPE